MLTKADATALPIRGACRRGIFALIAGLACALAPTAWAAFGLTTTTGNYTVDTGAGLVFSVRRQNLSSTQHQGDISSMVFNGTEYQDQLKGSQVGIGIGGGTVSAQQIGTSYVVVTVTDPDGNVTHYYMARNGYPYIYMATYFTSEPSLGNVRYITRIPYSLLPHGPAPSDLSGNTGAIESSDIFGMADGTTRSKHYSNHRQLDWTYTGATGSNVAVWMVKANTEGMSGGPFYRCLINQASSAGDQEIYEMINYGEAQTEAFRTSILNQYTLVFTTGATPPSIDTSWESNLGLIGYVGSAGRGGVAGVGLAGTDGKHQYVVGFANARAQYWAVANPANGYYYSSYGMLPGTYTQTVYKGELAVWTGSVTVTAGSNVALHTITITGDPSNDAVLWRIGDWDGSPQEFLNGANLTTMHPSDSRLASWGPVTYTVGTSATSTFPAYQWKDPAINQPTTIKFNLTAAQVTNHTVRIGITTAYSNGRPQITVNGWTSTVPAASTQPSTRTLTIGSYRGNNTTFTYAVPASAFVAGTNTLTINVASGSGATSGYLTASYSNDCIDLQ